MDVRRWQRIEAIFEEVVDLPPGREREAGLATLCGSDASLERDVRVLLHREARLREDDAATDPHLSLRLGAFRVDRLLGRGGMAAVYAAHRADDVFEQQVAIKIMDLRLDDSALVAQFKAERQILAGLAHPAITRLLDGGVTPLGEPYLVMELVDGVPIDRHCDERRLDLAERLRLFQDVCDAVAFAHRALVLHRDLKPSNILITTDGHVKVADFGTATLLRPDRLATTSAAPLTPAYASPEQLLGQAVGTASDQYALGLVLYELVTGARAFGERISLMASVERALAGTEPLTAQTTVTPEAAAARQLSVPRLRRHLSGDLGTIVRKALAHEPGARYASVQHLADDVARWREGAAIEGRPPTVAYHVTRFVRRHWVATGVAATLALGLAAATIVSAQQARLARLESVKARQLSRFLENMLSSVDPAIGATRAGAVTVREVLDTAGPLVPQTLGATPDVAVEMMRVIGVTYTGVGVSKEGEAYLRQAIAGSRELQDEIGAARSSVSLGLSLINQGRYPEAEQVLRAARDVVTAHQADFDARTRLASANLLALARSYQKTGDDEVLQLYRDSLASPDADAEPVEAGIAAHNLGLQLVFAGRLDEAERWLRESARRFEFSPVKLASRYMVSRSMSELMRTVRNYPEAVRHGRVAVEGLANALPAGHAYHPPALTTLGRALVLNGEVEEGELVLTKALGLFLEIRPKGHVELLGVQLGLGAAYRSRGQLEASERILREAQAATAKATVQMRAGVLGELGLTLRARGRTAEGQALLQESLEVFQSYLQPSHPYVAMARSRVAGASE